MEINRVHLLNHQIIRDLPFGVIVVDRDLNIGDWNVWMERHTGLTRPEVQGKDLSHYFPVIREPEPYRTLQSVFETGRLVQLPYDQVERFLVFDNVPNSQKVAGMLQDTELRPLFDTEGEVAGVCIVIHDVTERVQRLRELEKLNRDFVLVNSALAEADRVKSSFLSNTSHELRTPLTSILGFVEILENDLANSEEEKAEFLGNIRKSAQDLLDVVNHLLQAAAIQAGRIKLEVVPVALVEVLSDVQANHHPAAKRSGIELPLNIEELDLEVMADYIELRQALSSIIDNSLKFTSQGTISISAYRSSNTPDKVVIEVKDTGLGIPPDRIHTVFEPFSQVDDSSRRKVQGAGLGLSISKALVERMGGSISISSEGEGKGTTVCLILPIALPD